MMKFFYITVLLFCGSALYAQKIDRKALVERHTVKIEHADALASLTVGNGKFAMTVDVTGLQTFPDFYAEGVPLGTQAEWAWDSFKNTAGHQLEDSFKAYQQYGRTVTYAVQNNTSAKAKQASDWFRQNKHRLQLGNLGFVFYDKLGKELGISAIKSIHQELNMYTGTISSLYEVDGEKVQVKTIANQNEDGVLVSVQSALITKGRLKVRLKFPYPNGEWIDVGNYYGEAEKHQTQIVKKTISTSSIKHQLQGSSYFTSLDWSGKAQLKEQNKHEFVLSPATSIASFELSVRFSQTNDFKPIAFQELKKSNLYAWENFWQSGAAVDFSGSTDTRAKELERRVILSQYLTKIQCAGNYPPQETGLTYNSWFGKPHLEMHWWHAVHFALWGRADILRKSTDWYFKVKDTAKAIATRQGFDGVRWQKMTDNEGAEVPSSVGAMLIWQQPHPITFIELLYRDKPSDSILHRYKDLVFATADFMASFAHLNPKTKKYDLGPVLIPAQERFKAEETFNPTYELCYWKWALQTAQTWRKRLGLPENEKWNMVMNNLAPLPVQNHVYLATESATDSYTNPKYKTDHPSVLGAFGMLPQTGMVDTSIMKNTFELILKDWTWNDTWGWDFPMTAMTATRLGMPNKAIDALLMPIKTNTYLVNGHNYQDDRLRIYLPGNGGLLTAIALMCAGWDGHETPNIGFPKDGTWKVRSEGFKKMF